MTKPLLKIVYSAQTHTTGGREGRTISSDGHLDIALSLPQSMGGSGGATNPEQLFAAGYSACFLGALKFQAGIKDVLVPDDVSIDATVELGPTGECFGLAVSLSISLPGLNKVVAHDLIEAAHANCPYSIATRGNIPVTITLT